MVSITFGFLIILSVRIETAFCVLGGQNAKPTDFPAQVAITIAHSDGNKPNILCGGTILDENHIVTAASCVCIDNELVANKRVSVQAGSVMLPDKTDKLNVAAIFLHGSFNPQSSENDIAVIRMEKKFDNFKTEDPTATVSSAALPKEIIPDSTKCKVSGWYPTESEKESPLKFLEIMTFNRDKQCNSNENHAGRVLENMLCAGNAQQPETMAVCESNRGGGLYCNNQLTGVLSFGLDCGKTKKPGVYTQVRMYTDWILEKLKDKSVPSSGPIKFPSSPSGTDPPNNGNDDPTPQPPGAGSASSISFTLPLFVGFLIMNLVM